jgi:hypothetical protein
MPSLSKEGQSLIHDYDPPASYAAQPTCPNPDCGGELTMFEDGYAWCANCEGWVLDRSVTECA